MTSSAGWSSLSDRASSLRATGASMPLSPTLETVEEKANNLSRNAALRDFGNAIRSPLKLGAFPTPSNVQSSSLERTHRLLDRLDPGVAEAAALLDGAREQRSMDCVQVGDLDTSALLLSGKNLSSSKRCCLCFTGSHRVSRSTHCLHALRSV